MACDAWAWRERLQRAIDGCHHTDDMNAASMAEYHGARPQLWPALLLKCWDASLATLQAQCMHSQHG